MDDNQIENNDNQKGLENLILLVLGAKDIKISILHLEKEVFLIWNFHPSIKVYLNFIEHYRGPYSPEITETIREPMYLDNCWVYIPPKDKDYISGGYVKLTFKGRNEYNRILRTIKESQNDELMHLLTAINIARQLYDELSLDELLLLIYDTYPRYTKASEEYNRINKDRISIAKQLKDKGIIDIKRYYSLVEG